MRIERPAPASIRFCTAAFRGKAGASGSRSESVVPRLASARLRDYRLLSRRQCRFARVAGTGGHRLHGRSITEDGTRSGPNSFIAAELTVESADTTSQMVLRMFSDVVALRPKAVHIMAGTNDIAGNTGPMTAGMTEDNIRAMVDIAQRHGIKVLLAPVPPPPPSPGLPKSKLARVSRN